MDCSWKSKLESQKTNDKVEHNRAKYTALNDSHNPIIWTIFDINPIVLNNFWFVPGKANTRKVAEKVEHNRAKHKALNDNHNPNTWSI